MKLSDQDKKRIEQAVKKAEATTSGEIVPVIVKTSDPYLSADLTGGLIGIALGLFALIWLVPVLESLLFVSVLTGSFLAGFFLTRYLPPIKRMLLGKKILEAEVYQRALQAFFELGLTRTRDRTGILIMVSLLEHRIQIIADQGINEKVPKGTWDEVVALILGGIKNESLADGICSGIERCGRILTNDFPIKPDDTNELSNELVIED